MQRHRLICDNKECTFLEEYPNGIEIDPKDFHKALRFEIPCEKCSTPMKLQKDDGFSWSYVDSRQKGRKKITE